MCGHTCVSKDVFKRYSWQFFIGCFSLFLERDKEMRNYRIYKKIKNWEITFFFYNMLFTMLYQGQVPETIIFVIISKRNEWLIFILLFVWRTGNGQFRSRGKELLHYFKIFFFSLCTGQQWLDLCSLSEECAWGFNFLNAWSKEVFWGKPSLDSGFWQFGLFIKFRPPFNFKDPL